jgi:tetratricopeptide (TPR) repeat protein
MRRAILHGSVVRFGMTLAMMQCLPAQALATVDRGARVATAHIPKEPPAPRPSSAVQRVLIKATWLLKRQHPQEALRTANRALEAAQSARDVAGKAQSYNLKAQALASMDRMGEAVAAWQEAAGAWEQAGHGPGRVAALASAGLLVAERNPQKTPALISSAIAVGRAEGERPLAAAHALVVAGKTGWRRRLVVTARELFEAALAIREAHVPDSVEAEILAGLGALALDRGELEEARKYSERALHRFEMSIPISHEVVDTLHFLAYTAVLRQQPSDAKPMLERSLTLQRKLGAKPEELARTFDLLQMASVPLGQWEEAAEYSRRSQELLMKRTEGPLEEAQRLSKLGERAMAQKDALAALGYMGYSMAVVTRGQRDLTTTESYGRRAWRIVRRQGQPVTGDEAGMAYRSSTLHYAAFLASCQLALKVERAGGFCYRGVGEGPDTPPIAG